VASKKTIWDLSLEIAGKDTGASQAIRTVKKQLEDLKGATKQLGKDWKDFTGNASKLALGVAGGVTAATAGVIAMANSFAETGDKVAKTSAAIGIGIEAYQGLQYAMGQSGVSAEEFDKALQKFNLTVRQGAAGNAAAQKQLEDIGLSAQKLAGMKPEQAMERLSDYMNTLPSDAERTRVAVTLFGKAAGPKMMAAMKQGSAGLRQMMDEAKSLGIVLTEEQAYQSEAYGDAMDRLKQSVTGMKNQFIGGAIGPLTEAFDHLKDAIVDQMPAIQELGAKFGVWLGELVQRLPEIIAKIKEFGAILL
jgi:cytochrome c556